MATNKAVIAGWAMTSDHKERQQHNADELRRFNDLGVTIEDFVRSPQYGRTSFSGRVMTHRSEVTARQLALFADHGNLCFGGTCQYNQDTGHFSGSYYID